MKKEITVNLSSESIRHAMKEVKDYNKALEKQFRRAIVFLAEESARHLKQSMFLDSITVQYELVFSTNSIGFVLTAVGDSIGFIEFGTGVYADEQHPFREEAPFPVFPGSYSDTVGAGTWNDWVNVRHLPPEKYPYNHIPLRPLYETAEWIRNNAERLIKWSMQNDYYS